MAPSRVEDAVHSNGPLSSTSGLLSNAQAQQEQWTPETVLSTLPTTPEVGSSSPIPFLHLMERLKTTKREGWRRFGIAHGESIADHMYRMSIMTLLCPPALAARLDLSKCTRMALVHDMAEALVGDITPVDGVSKVEKSRREAGTMDYLCGALLGGVQAGVGGTAPQAIRDVWQEYEDGQTLESAFVHDVDKVELLLQMVEYERAHAGRIDLGEFSRVAGRIALPELRDWAAQLLAERDAFWAANGTTPSFSEASEELKRQQDEYYGSIEGGAANGTAH